MNNTYNRLLTLVVNERLEEGKKLDAVKHAGKIVLGGAALTAAMGLASNKLASKPDPNAESSRALTHIQSKTHGTKGQVEGQAKPVGGLSPHPKLGKYGVKVARPSPRVVKNESVMNNTYDRLLDLVTETGPVKTRNKAKKREFVQSKDDADYNNPSYRAIISSRKAARHDQRPGAAQTAHGREALKRKETK